jgi:spermidine/putrescine transport system substrate-binding protein
MQGLSSGDLWVCFITTADPTILGDPEVQFSYAREGSLALIDSIVIPVGSPNRESAQKLIEYWYDPKNAARLIEELNYQNFVRGAQDIVRASDPALADNPMVFPPPPVQQQIYSYPRWSEDQAAEISQMWEQLTGR